MWTVRWSFSEFDRRQNRRRFLRRRLWVELQVQRIHLRFLSAVPAHVLNRGVCPVGKNLHLVFIAPEETVSLAPSVHAPKFDVRQFEPDATACIPTRQRHRNSTFGIRRDAWQ